MAQNDKTVLVADDEANVHEFVKVALEDEGITIVSAANGDEALEKARSCNPDLVILDVQMPEKDGFQVFAELRADPSTETVPVIMLTAIGELTGLRFNAKDMREFIGKEPDAYIEKPVDPALLQSEVKRLLREDAE